jgi:hypothetical protein
VLKVSSSSLRALRSRIVAICLRHCPRSLSPRHASAKGRARWSPGVVPLIMDGGSTAATAGQDNGELKVPKLRFSALAAALIASASVAHAQVQTFERSGGWSAFAGSNDGGTPMCGMSIIGSNARHAMIKWQLGGSGIFVQLFKQSWNIPPGTKMPIVVQFDRATPFEGVATHRDRTIIEVWLQNGSEEGTADIFWRFMDQFMAADKMYFSFPGGSENSWVASMDGSEKVGRAFTRCIATYYERYGKQSQPHRGGDATQPYSGGSEATQPYGAKKPGRSPPVGQFDKDGI